MTNKSKFYKLVSLNFELKKIAFTKIMQENKNIYFSSERCKNFEKENDFYQFYINFYFFMICYKVLLTLSFPQKYI